MVSKKGNLCGFSTTNGSTTPILRICLLVTFSCLVQSRLFLHFLLEI